MKIRPILAIKHKATLNGYHLTMKEKGWQKYNSLDDMQTSVALRHLNLDFLGQCWIAWCCKQ